MLPAAIRKAILNSGGIGLLGIGGHFFLATFKIDCMSKDVTKIYTCI